MSAVNPIADQAEAATNFAEVPEVVLRTRRRGSVDSQSLHRGWPIGAAAAREPL